MTGAKFRSSAFVVWSCLWTAGGLAGGARPCICAQAGTMERNFAQALGLSRPATLRGWPIRARSGILHASWNGQVPIPAQIGIGLLVASVHLSLLPSALVSVSPRSARPAALGCTSADTVPAPRQNDRIHSARVPDRKSTRLNSSHSSISYAVFCLKKKKKTKKKKQKKKTKTRKQKKT